MSGNNTKTTPQFQEARGKKCMAELFYYDKMMVSLAILKQNKLIIDDG